MQHKKTAARKRHQRDTMKPRTPRVLFSYLGFLFLFSLPVWVLAVFVDTTKIIPVKLPLSALLFLVVPIAAALALRQKGTSIRRLVWGGPGIMRVTSGWLAASLLLMPFLVGTAYLSAWVGGAEISTQLTPLASLPVFVLIYAVSGFCEELGWTTTMGRTLLQRYGVVQTGILVGLSWAVWHFIPFLQTGHTLSWVFWQSLFTVLFRIFLIKTYVATGRNLWAVVAMHASYNVAFSFLPYYGSSYKPLYTSLALGAMLLVVLPLRKNAALRLR